MSYTNGTQTQSQSMNGLLEISTDNITADTITTGDLIVNNDQTIDGTLTVGGTIYGTCENANNASQVAVSNTTSGTKYISMFEGTGNRPCLIDTDLYYDSSANILTATNITGNTISTTDLTSTGTITALDLTTTGTINAVDLSMNGSITQSGTVYNTLLTTNLTGGLTTDTVSATGGMSSGGGVDITGYVSVGESITSPYLTTYASITSTPFSPSASDGNNMQTVGAYVQLTSKPYTLSRYTSNTTNQRYVWTFTTPVGYSGGTATLNIPISTYINAGYFTRDTGGLTGSVILNVSIAEQVFRIYKNGSLWRTLNATLVSGSNSVSYTLNTTSTTSGSLIYINNYMGNRSVIFTPDINDGDVYTCRFGHSMTVSASTLVNVASLYFAFSSYLNTTTTGLSATIPSPYTLTGSSSFSGFASPTLTYTAPPTPTATGYCVVGNITCKNPAIDGAITQTGTGTNTMNAITVATNGNLTLQGSGLIIQPTFVATANKNQIGYIQACAPFRMCYGTQGLSSGTLNLNNGCVVFISSAGTITLPSGQDGEIVYFRKLGTTAFTTTLSWSGITVRSSANATITSPNTTLLATTVWELCLIYRTSSTGWFVKTV